MEATADTHADALRFHTHDCLCGVCAYQSAAGHTRGSGSAVARPPGGLRNWSGHGTPACNYNLSRDSPAALLGWCGTLAPLFVRPAALAPLPWPIVGGALQMIGQALALSATLALGRSFGIVAANRGIQTGGLYRIVRHPLYAAYLLAFGGYVLAHPSHLNSGVLLVWVGIQMARIHAEERLLGADPCYCAYAARVRFRLLAGIW